MSVVNAFTLPSTHSSKRRLFACFNLNRCNCTGVCSVHVLLPSFSRMRRKRSITTRRQADQQRQLCISKSSFDEQRLLHDTPCSQQPCGFLSTVASTHTETAHEPTGGNDRPAGGRLRRNTERPITGVSSPSLSENVDEAGDAPEETRGDGGCATLTTTACFDNATGRRFRTVGATAVVTRGDDGGGVLVANHPTSS